MIRIFIVDDNYFDGWGFLGIGLLCLFCVLAVPISIRYFYFSPSVAMPVRLGFSAYAVVVSVVCAALIKRPYSMKGALPAATARSIAAAAAILCVGFGLYSLLGPDHDVAEALLFLVPGPIICGAIFLPLALATCAAVLGFRKLFNR